MLETIFLGVLFIAKMLDNALETAKTILIQKNKSIIAGITLGISSYIRLSITKHIVSSNSQLALIVVSVAGCIGCCIAIYFNNRFSKVKTYINVIMSDDMNAMMELREFLIQHKITNVATDSYTKDFSSKTLVITAYAETKEQSKLIDRFLEQSDTKFKRMVEGEKIKQQKKVNDQKDHR